ncbi:DUF309 domain-containing protein [Paenibacillus flagellatus]|uniref:5'-deoxynucleotidase n=1 Tax=Paenibacillus flagellatus TaxID=2211139 RepID=A0A2V5KV47_9BACL|nr:hypothetical protein DLM86_09575 [Paenibacillus flagellatus]
MYPDEYVDYMVHFHADRDWFECHELLEEYWKRHPADRRSKTWVGLIQTAVSLYHHRRGNRAGALKMATAALANADDAHLSELGIDAAKFREELERRRAMLAHDESAPFSDMDIPIADESLLRRCVERSAELGLEWGRPSDPADRSVADKHTLRDRSEVVEARRREAERRRRKREGERGMEHVASRLERQIAFILEIDKLKHVFRKSRLIRSERFENDAEHTWHLAVMAVLLAEHANEPELDLLKVLKMLLIHDLVEIDAGDTFAYDEKGLEGKYEREKAAADRLFGLLPDDQRDEFQALWEEFEARATAEAAFAAAVDRLQPMLFNYENEGQSWKEHGITSDRVLARNRQIGEGSETLWRYAERMIVEAEKRGFFSNETIEPKS